MVILIDAEKTFDKIQHIFIIKALKKLGKEGMYLKIKKAIHDSHTAVNILNGEILKSFLLKSRTKQVCPLSLLFLYISLEFLARAIKQEKF
jgi:hypothetical protein